MIGASARRLEDPPLLRGTARFVDDIDFHDQVHMRVVRSPVAHGHLVKADGSRAARQEGVVAVWSADDLGEIPFIDFRLTSVNELLPFRQPVLARRRVRYVGEPVAVVLARSAYIAEDVAELVDIEIEPLEAVIGMGAEPVPWSSEDCHDEEFDNEPFVVDASYGDVEAAFAEATHVAEVDVQVGRHSGVPMECRGAVAYVDEPTGQLVVAGAAKVPYWNRDALARMLGWPASRVVLREGDVGGGFGVRGELYPEDYLVAYAAVRLGVPVKWIEDRQEHLVAANHSRDQRHRLRAALDDNGIILAIEGEFWLNQGGYVRTHSATVGHLTASMLPGPYRIPNYRVRGHIRLTNKTPAGTYRSPGRYEGTFARERLLDRAANELGMDPVTLRERNLIPVEAMPYRRDMKSMGTELVYDSGDYQRLLDRMRRELDLPGLHRQVEERRSAGELVGVGYGFFVEKSGLGPYEGVRLTIDTSGAVTVETGASSVGQGVDTVIAQIVADKLGVSLAEVRVVRGQTDRFEQGRGAFATRLSVMAGSAAHLAAISLRQRLLELASERLQVALKDLILAEGHVSVAGYPQSRISYGELSGMTAPELAQARDRRPGLQAEEWFYTDHMTYPYGIHVAVIRVDRGTGDVAVERYLVGYDVGRALNPQLVEGQIVGGVVQGLGGALYEEFTYDENGQPTATTFIDYRLPTITEVPSIDVLITEDAPSPLNPLGVKGAGEGGVNGVGAAVAAAIDDAVGYPGWVDRLPVSPARVRRLLASRKPDGAPARAAGLGTQR